MEMLIFGWESFKRKISEEKGVAHGRLIYYPENEVPLGDCYPHVFMK